MSANSSFKHRPLDFRKSRIRLFRLLSTKPDKIQEGEIIVCDTERCPQYRALSYTWGPPSPNREILVDGQSFTVRENLWQFLYTAHGYSDGWLWIDQICIDQNVVDERNHQVGIMSGIFANAATVLIWLGVEANGSSEAIDAINNGYDSTIEHERNVQALTERPYFKRLWIIQEVLMSRTAWVLCGDRNFSWEQLQSLFVPRSSDDSFWIPPVDINETVLSLIKEREDFTKQRLSFIIHTFAKSQCEDPRDKVYGLLSLVRDSGVIPVDYSKKPVDVFLDAIQRIVQDEDVMDFNSHVDVGRYLRDSMALDIEDSKIYAYVKNERQKARKPRNDQVMEDASWRAQNGQTESIGLLLSTGKIDVNAKDKFGWTLLYKATLADQEEMVELLLSTEKVDVDVGNRFGMTPLMVSAQRGHNKIVELLLSIGKADVNAKNDEGQTAMIFASMYGRKKVVELLLGTGEVDVDAKDGLGLTALMWAEEDGNEKIADILWTHGSHLGSQ